MAEKKKSEFKREFYIKWHYADWLQDPNVRMLQPEHKGFWMDLICQMAMFFPFGHCSKLNATKLKKSGNPAIKKFLVEDLVNQKSNGEVDRLIELQVELLLEEQLEVSDNMEDQLHLFLPYSPDAVKYHIQAIEDEGVFSRTPSGIIYSRRLVRDFRKRVVAFKNGRNGGNPSITGKPARKKSARNSSSESPEIGLVGDLVNQNPNHGVGNSVEFLDKPFPNYNYNYNKENNSSIRNLTDSKTLREGDSQGETKNPNLAELKNSEWISIAGFSDKTTPEDFATWQKFQRTIDENRLDEIRKCAMVNPNDFTELVKKHGFTENKWLPVLRHMLGSGIKPEHNLFFRIPQFIGYVYRSQKDNGLHTGNGDFTKMENW